MPFGGHETFAIREGWLHKGLAMLIDRPDQLLDEHVADYLGVGRNMAKSIKHWLVATQLAEKPDVKGGYKHAKFVETPLGKLIHKADPYLLHPGTWWALHVNLVSNPAQAYSWSWFFNAFRQARFERAVCVAGIRRKIEMLRKRLPSPKTLDRDVACLLTTYARVIPEAKVDPEDVNHSPFRDLGLLSHYRESGAYQLHQGAKPIPPELLGYTLSKAFRPAAGKQKVGVSLQDAARKPGAPGGAFALTAESLFEVATLCEEQCEDIEVAGLAGERIVRYLPLTPEQWLTRYYKRVNKKGGRRAA